MLVDEFIPPADCWSVTIRTYAVHLLHGVYAGSEVIVVQEHHYDVARIATRLPPYSVL